MSADPSMAFAAMQSLSALAGGFSEASAMDANADVLDENARQTTLLGEQEAAQTYRDERQVSGAAIAAMAESGTAVGTGTAVDIIRQNAIEAEVEVGNIRARRGAEARDYRQQAVDLRHAAGGARIGAVFGALSPALDYAVTADARKRLDAQRDIERASRQPRPARSKTARNPLVPKARLGVLSLPGGR